MASQTTYNILTSQGATFRLPIRWYTDSTKATLRDLSSHTARLQVRKTHLSADTFIDFSEIGEIDLSDGSGTENIVVSLTDEETAALDAPFRGVYELLLTNPIGDTTRVLRGEWMHEPGVVR